MDLSFGVRAYDVFTFTYTYNHAFYVRIPQCSSAYEYEMNTNPRIYLFHGLRIATSNLNKQALMVVGFDGITPCFKQEEKMMPDLLRVD